MNIVIQPAVIEDLEAMSGLLDQLFAIERDFKPDRAKQRKGLAMLLCNKTSVLLVARSEGTVVGMATMQELISTAEGGPVGLVEDVVVDQARRGQGIGRRLLLALEQEAQVRGWLRLQLLADLNNQPALAFYRQLNWQTTQLIALRQTKLV